jgi:hypothetical protein
VDSEPIGCICKLPIKKRDNHLKQKKKKKEEEERKKERKKREYT